jgi:hypothetical protein
MTSPSLARAAAGLVTEGRLPEDLTSAGLSADEINPARLRRDEASR